MDEFRSAIKHDVFVFAKAIVGLVTAAVISAIAVSFGYVGIAQFLLPAAMGGAVVYLYDKAWPSHLKAKEAGDS